MLTYNYTRPCANTCRTYTYTHIHTQMQCVQTGRNIQTCIFWPCITQHQIPNRMPCKTSSKRLRSRPANAIPTAGYWKTWRTTTGERLTGHLMQTTRAPFNDSEARNPPGGALGLERAPFTDRPRVSAVSLCLFNLSGRRKARPPDRPYTPETQHSQGTASC